MAKSLCACRVHMRLGDIYLFAYLGVVPYLLRGCAYPRVLGMAGAWEAFSDSPPADR